MLNITFWKVADLTGNGFPLPFSPIFNILEPEPDRIVPGEPWIQQQPDPDPDVAGSRSGQTGSRPGYFRI